MTPWDRTLLFAVLLAGAVIFGAGFLADAATGGESYARVSTPFEERYLDLSRDERVVVEGALGDVVVDVRAGEVRVVGSPCANQRCVHMGPVSAAGGAIVCVPGGVSIEPFAAEVGGLDDVVR